MYNYRSKIYSRYYFSFSVLDIQLSWEKNTIKEMKSRHLKSSVDLAIFAISLPRFSLCRVSSSSSFILHVYTMNPLRLLARRAYSTIHPGGRPGVKYIFILLSNELTFPFH